jgi:hypothetical protein
MLKSLPEEKRQEWQEKILQQKNSGKSVSRWCREHQISYNGFVYWKRRLNLSSSLKRSSFKELDFPKEAGLKIEGRGICITLSDNFDDITLIRFIRAFGGSSC